MFQFKRHVSVINVSTINDLNGWNGKVKKFSTVKIPPPTPHPQLLESSKFRPMSGENHDNEKDWEQDLGKNDEI